GPLNRQDRIGQGYVSAYATKDGSFLWKAQGAEGYNTPIDVFVIDNLVWIGPYNKKVATKNGYDLKTGTVVKSIKTKGDPVGMLHDRCYRNKASLSHIFSCRDGIEVHDLKDGWVRNNSWTRGPCTMGVMPANGLMYVPHDPCACHLRSRMSGFKAYSSELLPSIGQPIKEEGRLFKGPAYGSVKPSKHDSQLDWPVYRKDNERSSNINSNISLPLKSNWTTQIGGQLTQPIVAGKQVFVASKTTNTVYALDSKTGKVKWHFVAGGELDSPPTYSKGRVLFGSGNGKLYCLNAANGQLAYIFNAAPENRSICIRSKISSTWPIHSTVIAQDDEIYFTAGLSSYLSGGIYFYCLDLLSGKMKHYNIISNIDPKTEKYVGVVEKGFDSDGVVSDILTSDGEHIFFKHMQLSKKGDRVKSSKAHLFSPTSLLHEEWFVRSYWTYAKDINGAGYGGWPKTGSNNPSGRILCFNENRIYGYGREVLGGGKTGHKSNTYHLYASPKEYIAQNPSKAKTNNTSKKKKKKSKGPVVTKTFSWKKSFPLTLRAMVSTANTLLLAGVPNPSKRLISEHDRLHFEDPKLAIDAFTGKHGASLWAADLKTGESKKQVELSAAPCYDGMSVAGKDVFH
ncbi:MAG: PQQ-like beta-propeller repeat protein, partial [Planctomycetes bacterium]|nr:PQQ-like beta-propeller repeat protein [Planctomycetota bacterium]